MRVFWTPALRSPVSLAGIPVILYYDHAVTFDEEYWRVWRTPGTGASILFLVNRYFAFFSVRLTSTDDRSIRGRRADPWA